jgi:hypothetical protein
VVQFGSWKRIDRGTLPQVSTCPPCTTKVGCFRSSYWRRVLKLTPLPSFSCDDLSAVYMKMLYGLLSILLLAVCGQVHIFKAYGRMGVFPVRPPDMVNGICQHVGHSERQFLMSSCTTICRYTTITLGILRLRHRSRGSRIEILLELVALGSATCN